MSKDVVDVFGRHAKSGGELIHERVRTFKAPGVLKLNQPDLIVSDHGLDHRWENGGFEAGKDEQQLPTSDACRNRIFRGDLLRRQVDYLPAVFFGDRIKHLLDSLTGGVILRCRLDLKPVLPLRQFR